MNPKQLNDKIVAHVDPRHYADFIKMIGECTSIECVKRILDEEGVDFSREELEAFVEENKTGMGKEGWVWRQVACGGRWEKNTVEGFTSCRWTEVGADSE